ncbi:MAG: hypothetical protein L0K86_14565 [Actinomycetia bacterium]|nr:hypothetical protein [Actinomycetes bacterium]
MAVRTLVGTAAVTVPGDESSWVEPDYLAVLSAADVAESPEELIQLEPGPPMLMPADLLPDGRPWAGDMFDVAERITGVRPRNTGDAETVVRRYWVQQTALREAAGIPQPRQDSSGRYVEDPQSLAAIRELHRRERQRRRLLETPPEVAVVLDRVADAVLHGADELLRTLGYCQPPNVHMVCTDMDPPYAGWMRSREFYRGADAAAAVTEMGRLPAAIAASHLVVSWDHADLCTALELPGESFPSGVVVVVASISEHTVRWHPYTAHVGPLCTEGVSTIQPEWGRPCRYPAGELPTPIARLVGTWREWTDADLPQLVAELEQAGYSVRWAARS